jgi:hypothetical protein
VEVLSFTDERSAAALQQYSDVLKVYNETLALHIAAFLTPHAPYSISPEHLWL